MINSSRKYLIDTLQKDIMHLQGNKKSLHAANHISLGPVNDAFPGGLFPLGCVHEFLATGAEEAASSIGFMMATIAQINTNKGVSLWISADRHIFTPALPAFGILPEHIIFCHLQKATDRLWAMEEALKCSGLSAIICESADLSFTASRRLQLAVEKSGVTGFIMRLQTRQPGITATTARWKITPLPSESIDDLPGIGYPCWHVNLLKIRNGKPGSWNISLVNQQFRAMQTDILHKEEIKQRMAG